jgi:hypothetical protein
LGNNAVFLGEYFQAWCFQLQAQAVFFDCFTTQDNIRPVAQLLNLTRPEFEWDK